MAMLSTLLVACDGQKAEPLAVKGTDITGARFGGDFTLTDHRGKQRALSEFRGKVVVLFFGYTHCPDVCPTTMMEYANAIKLLGKQAEEVQLLFVTVDPKRDTPAVLANYVPYFNPHFIGLTGAEDELQKVLTQFKIVALRVPDSNGGYMIDHSAGSYLFDKKGRLRVYEPYAMNASALSYDIRELLR